MNQHRTPMTYRLNALAVSIVLLAVLTGCSRPAQRADNAASLYQVSSFNALADGGFEAITTVGQLKQHGNLGIGTFEGLNGEMIVLDGRIYQARADGTVAEPADSAGVPFASVTRFVPTLSRQLGALSGYAALTTTLDGLMPRKDSFYAIRVQAAFAHVKVRTIAGQSKPYPTLADALKAQVFSERSTITGTIVGIWAPDYVGGTTVAGYNLHFISADHAFGGHLVEAEFSSAQADIQELRDFELALSTR